MTAAAPPDAAVVGDERQAVCVHLGVLATGMGGLLRSGAGARADGAVLHGLLQVATAVDGCEHASVTVVSGGSHDPRCHQ